MDGGVGKKQGWAGLLPGVFWVVWTPGDTALDGSSGHRKMGKVTLQVSSREASSPGFYPNRGLSSIRLFSSGVLRVIASLASPAALGVPLFSICSGVCD